MPTFTSPPDKATGDQISESDWDTYIKDNMNALNARLAAIEFSGARWTKTATQSIADSAATNVSFPTAEVYDQGSWGLTVSNTTATVPAGAIPAGYTQIAVYVSTYVEFANDADGRRIIALHKNGAEIAAAQWNPSNNVSTSMSVSTEVDVVAGDTFTVVVYHEAGAALNVNKGSFVISRRGPF